MIEITPVVLNENRFLGIVVYLPKCTMRLLFNMKLIVTDRCFNLNEIEKKCPIPIVQCASLHFDHLDYENVLKCSKVAVQLGIQPHMAVKEAIGCVFPGKKPSEECF